MGRVGSWFVPHSFASTPLAPQAGREPRYALPSGSRLRPVCDARM